MSLELSRILRVGLLLGNPILIREPSRLELLDKTPTILCDLQYEFAPLG
jgi:hypothetical protein